MITGAAAVVAGAGCGRHKPHLVKGMNLACVEGSAAWHMNAEKKPSSDEEGQITGSVMAVFVINRLGFNRN
jgi:hypothetical protein